LKGYRLSDIDYKLKNVFGLKASVGNEHFTECIFYDYCPHVFRALRESQGLDSNTYLNSVGPQRFVSGLVSGNIDTLAELTSSGKSGSFFYYTPDGKYMLKTIAREEFEVCIFWAKNNR
jgi:1-phosphatidylinositol-4-phosphate 5-kinase